MDTEVRRTSGRVLAEHIAGQGMLRLVKQSVEEKSTKVTAMELSSEGQQHSRAALTFDDGPDSRYTPILLDGLKERDVHASFFLLGEKIRQYPELVQRMQEEGHLVGNHTYHHVQLDKLNETGGDSEDE